jgi:hypothetical protein
MGDIRVSPTKKKFDLSKVKTRFEPPTLEDAIFAAQGLSDDPDHQVAIAAQLAGRPETEVKAGLLKARSTEIRVVTTANRRQPLIVERRRSRAVSTR